MKRNILLVLLTVFSLNASTYFAFFPYESDTLFTAWLIRKYKDREALFAGIEKGTRVDIPSQFLINTPKSPYRRDSRFTAYEVAIKKLKVKDECAQRLVKVSRLLEMAPWRKQTYPEYVELERQMHAAANNPAPSNLEEVFMVIDEFCKNKSSK